MGCRCTGSVRVTMFERRPDGIQGLPIHGCRGRVCRRGEAQGATGWAPITASSCSFSWLTLPGAAV